MPEVPRFVSFLSDYGTVDEFAGVCRAVMLGLAPELTIVDVTHEVPAHDVNAGALALVRAVQYLPDGIVLAVVDPGVGTERRTIAVESESGYFLGPDNGLLAPAVAMVGGAVRAVSLTNDEYHLASPGPTFAGRDVLAPAAGHLARGVPLGELGGEIDPAGMVPGLVSLPTDEDGSIVGEVWWVDRFGNCQLNIDPAELQRMGVGRRWIARAAVRRPGPHGPLGAHLRGREAVRARGARRLVRSRRRRARPPLRSRGARTPRRLGADGRPPTPRRSPVRPGTTIALAVLLVLILGAALLQFVFRVGP